MRTDQKLLLEKARDSLEAARLLAADEFYDFSASRSEEFIQLAEQQLER